MITFRDGVLQALADVAKSAKNGQATFITFSNVAPPLTAPSEERKGEMYGAML